MAKILNNLSINGNVPKVVELADEYIINGQVYDKNTFGPKPLEFCPVYVSGNNESMFYQTLMLNGTWNHNRNRNNVLVDINDPNICYVTSIGFDTTANITRFKRTSVGLEQLTVQPYGDNAVIEFVSQSATRIYGLVLRGGNYGYMFGINKNTMAVDFHTNFGDCRSKFLYDAPSFIYFCSTGATNSVSIQKFNKTNGQITTLLTDNFTGFNNYALATDPIVNSDNTITFYLSRDESYKTVAAGQHRIGYRKYVLDLNTELITASDITIDLSLLNPSPFIGITDNTSYIAYENFLIDDNGQKYLVLAVYNYGLTVRITPSKCGLYVFELTSADNFKLVSYKLFNPIVYKGLMPLFNNKLLIFANEDGVSFFNWNSATKSFEKTNTYPMPVKLVGVDLNNNIWIQQTDKSMEILANTLPISIVSDFEKDEYEFVGNDINTYITVYAQNYGGQYLSSTLELRLIGPVKFTDSGLNTKTITTTNTGEIQVPVTIYGSGQLDINFKVL